MARRMILILPILISCTLVHEPIQHDLFRYTIQKYTSFNNELTVNVNTSTKYVTEHHVLCIFHYSHFLQNYNTITLFFHLIVPFVINLCSALFIIIVTARQRSETRNKQTFREHVLAQLSEHRQLLISPFILFVLAMPRVILSLVSGCVDPSNNPWLYLCGYFVSYLPPMLIFVVFVLPSEVYTKTFKESITQWLRQIRQ